MAVNFPNTPTLNQTFTSGSQVYRYDGTKWVAEFTIADGSITTAKIADSAVNTTKMGGDVTTAGKTLLTGANAAAQRSSLGLGTAAVMAGPTGAIVGTSDTQTLTNKTLTTPAVTNPTVTDYTETVFAPAAGTAFSVSLANGSVQRLTTNGTTTITLPASVAGKSYIIIVAYGGAHALSITGGSTIKWAGGTAPTFTSASGKFDIFSFFCDGTNTYGAIIGQNY